jgi:hypothetical protein
MWTCRDKVPEKRFGHGNAMKILAGEWKLGWVLVMHTFFCGYFVLSLDEISYVKTT